MILQIKYFVDFLVSLTEKDQLATVHHFKADFMKYFVSTHGNEQCFHDWHGLYKSSDFRTAINAHIDFLFHQAMGVDGGLEKHTIVRIYLPNFGSSDGVLVVLNQNSEITGTLYFISITLLIL